MSAHRPIQAEGWVEDHYDDRVFQTARSIGLGGPIATMLSPGVPALAIFGSILDDRVLSFAKTLTDVSGFAVMIRPVGDNPVPLFSESDESDETLPRMPSPPGSGNQEDDAEDEDGDGDGADFEDEDGDQSSVQISNPSGSQCYEGPALRLRGGRGDDSDQDDASLPWKSKAHKAVVWLKLWPDEKHQYSLSVRTQTRVCSHQVNSFIYDCNAFSFISSRRMKRTGWGRGLK